MTYLVNSMEKYVHLCPYISTKKKMELRFFLLAFMISLCAFRYVENVKKIYIYVIS